MIDDYYLGIDPGTANIGWALVSPDAKLLVFGVIKILPEDRDDLLKTRYDLNEMVRTVENAMPLAVITYAAIEAFAMMGLKASVINAFQMGRTVELIRQTVRDFSIRAPRNRDVREWLCGSSKVKPSQVKAALVSMGYTERMNEHTRDALALALYTRVIERRGKMG